MSGSNYCGLHFEWNYKLGYVDVSMPGYIAKTLEMFQHVAPAKPQHTPHKWTVTTYNQKVQYAKEPPNLPTLGANGTKRIQKINGRL